MRVPNPLIAILGLLTGIAALSGCTRSLLLSPDAGNWIQRQLLIAYCCSAPATEKNVINAANEGFNLIPASEEALPYANRHSIRVMLEHGLLEPPTVHSPEKLHQLDLLIKRVKDNPALEAYYIVDEPQADSFPDIAKIIQYIRARDSKHLCFVNLQPIYGVASQLGQDPSRTYKNYLNKFVEVVRPDLISYDYYDFCHDKSGAPVDRKVYFVNLALVRQAALKAKIPFMNIIQASSFERDWRLPTAAEMRWQVYTTLVYGGRGISYFLYWGPSAYKGIYQDGSPTVLLQPIVQLNKEMSSLSRELMALRSKAVFHIGTLPQGAARLPDDSPVQISSAGNMVVGFFRKNGVDDSFMLVNGDYKDSTTAMVTIPGKSNIHYFDCATSSWQSVKNSAIGSFSITLEPGDGRLFRYRT